MNDKKRIFEGMDGGLFASLSNSVRLVLRLMADPRVPVMLKLLPVGAMFYLVFPFDLMPLIPIDDAIVVGMGTYIFIEMCPQDVVMEHQMAIRNESNDEPEEYIDVDFSE